MLFSAFLACVWIPYNMNEYDIPIYMRETESNVWLDFLKMRIIAFVLFITLSGCLPQFNFYNFSDLCLHTQSLKMDIVWTDSYQYVLVFLVWTITVPTFSFMFMRLIRDNLRYVCIPLIVSTAIFYVMITVLSAICIVSSIISPSHWTKRLSHIINLSVLGYTIMIYFCYKFKYSKRDLLKTEQEEIET